MDIYFIKYIETKLSGIIWSLMNPLLCRWTPCSQSQLPQLQATPGPLDARCPRPPRFPPRPCPPQTLSSWRWGQGPSAPTPRMALRQGRWRVIRPAWGPASQGLVSTWRVSFGMRQRKVSILPQTSHWWTHNFSTSSIKTQVTSKNLQTYGAIKYSFLLFFFLQGLL